MKVVIVEGPDWPRFAPFSLSRPVFALASGTGTLLDRQLRLLKPTRLGLWVRPEMEAFCQRHVAPHLGMECRINQPLDEEPALLVSASAMFENGWGAASDGAAEPLVRMPFEPTLGVDGSGNACWWWLCSSGHSHRRLSHPGLSHQDISEKTERWLTLQECGQRPSGCRLATYPWDLIQHNDAALRHDAGPLAPGAATMAGPYHAVNPESIRLGEGAKIGPGVVLDASSGPVVLGPGASIGANAVVIGPCYFGPGTQVAPLALIRGPTSVGPHCRIGGEVAQCIILGYTNKAHEGFLGHSYLGEWVNFGAGTTTSNLKNTYGKISMRISDRDVPTGLQFLGTLAGDHSKTAIATHLMTGTYIGYCCALAGSAHPPRFVPSFTFLTDKERAPYALDKAQAVMAAVFARRHRTWDATDVQMLRYVARIAPEFERSLPTPGVPS